MVPINISDNIQTSDHELHIQTQYLPGDTFLETTLFEFGTVLSKNMIKISSGLQEDEIKKLVLVHHQESLETLRFLFHMDNKIKSIRHIKSIIYLGNIYMMWGLLSEAIRAYENAMEIDLDCIEAALQISEAYLRKGDPEKAISFLRPFTEIALSQTDLFIKRGKAYLILKQYKNALSDFENTLQIEPESCDALLYKSICLLQIHVNHSPNKNVSSPEDYLKQAMTCLEEALKCSDILLAKDVEIALQFIKSNEITQAKKAILVLLNQIKYEKNINFYFIFYLRFVYDEEGRKPEAISRFLEKVKSMVRRFPNDQQFRMYLGTGYMIQCRDLFQQALFEFHSVRKSTESENSFQMVINEADRLGEQFVQFIKLVFY